MLHRIFTHSFIQPLPLPAVQKEPWLSRQATANGLARSPALSPGAAWAPGQLSPGRPARGSTHQAAMPTPSPGLTYTNLR